MRQNRYLIERSEVDNVLVLEGGLVYRMDYAELIRAHGESRATVTVACRGADRGPRPDVVFEVGEGDRLRGVTPLAVDPVPGMCAPMGVYLFDKGWLLDELSDDAAVAGADRLSPAAAVAVMAERCTACVYRFGGERGRVSPDRYWSDLRGIDAYFSANMALLENEPPLNLYQNDWNIMTYQGQYPPARTVPGLSGTEGIFVNSMIAAGTVISGGGVNHSILFPQVWVGDGAIVEDAILFDRVAVGQGAHLRRCIIDKDVQVPPGSRIGLDEAADRQRLQVSEGGVVVIPKGFRF
jgi:glucose-1-phosphate adenylyltransferase